MQTQAGCQLRSRWLVNRMMRRSMQIGTGVRAATAILVLLVGPACGASLQVTPFAPGKHPPRSAEHPLQMFSTRMPECPYEEVGLLRAEAETGLTRWQRVVDAFMAQARQMGGDAVILRQGAEIRVRDDGEVVGDDVLAGTVIRYQSTGCQR